LQNISPDIAEGLGITQPRGVLVASVTANSPAQGAGLTSGDVITSMDGIDIDDLASLNYRLATKPVGGKAEVIFVRKGKAYRTSFALIAAPETVPRNEMTIGDGSPLAGATVANLSPALADEMGYDDDPNGTVITDVADGSAAQRVGFRRGDRVVAINGVNIDTTQRLKTVTDGQTNRWTVRIRRNGQTIERQFRG
jgi:S1-C subfamily serine protease